MEFLPLSRRRSSTRNVPAAKGEEKQMFSQDTYYNSSQIFENVTAKWTFCVQQFFPQSSHYENYECNHCFFLF